MEEIVQKAISLGLQEIAITDHLEYDIEGMTDRWVLKVDKYVERVLELKEKFRKDILR